MHKHVFECNKSAFWQMNRKLSIVEVLKLCQSVESCETVLFLMYKLSLFKTFPTELDSKHIWDLFWFAHCQSTVMQEFHTSLFWQREFAGRPWLNLIKVHTYSDGFKEVKLEDVFIAHLRIWPGARDVDPSPPSPQVLANFVLPCLCSLESFSEIAQSPCNIPMTINIHVFFLSMLSFWWVRQPMRRNYYAVISF